MAIKTILIIDDEPEIRDLFGLFLQKHGFAVEKATNGLEGLKVLKKNRDIMLIILDERMPHMGGSDFLLNFRKKNDKLPVILLTGSINITSMSPEVRVLCQKTLFKPVRLSELLKVINSLLLKAGKPGRQAKTRKKKKNR